MKKTQSKSDWNRVLAHKEGDPIPFDPEDGPYDPNDPEAARDWFAQGRSHSSMARLCVAASAARKRLRPRSWFRCASRPK